MLLRHVQDLCVQPKVTRAFYLFFEKFYSPQFHIYIYEPFWVNFYIKGQSIDWGYCWLMTVCLFPHLLLKRLPCHHWAAFAPSAKTRFSELCTYLCGSFFRLCSHPLLAWCLNVTETRSTREALTPERTMCFLRQKADRGNTCPLARQDYGRKGQSSQPICASERARPQAQRAPSAF